MRNQLSKGFRLELTLQASGEVHTTWARADFNPRQSIQLNISRILLSSVRLTGLFSTKASAATPPAIPAAACST